MAWAERVASRISATVNTVVRSIVSTDRVLGTVADKRIAAITGAAGADMETGGVAQVAESAGVPWLALRAVADPASLALPPSVIGVLDDNGRVRAGALSAALLRHPGDLLHLPPLARGFRAALRALRTTARETGPSLLAPPLARDTRFVPMHRGGTL